MKLKNKTSVTDLYKSILALKKEVEVARFLRDLLTPAEIVDFATRFQVARLLDENETYENITSLTGMSSTTIARVAKWLKNGRGGYRLILDRLHHHPKKG